MNTTKETTMTQIERMLTDIKASGEAHGLSVRCPECNAGIGKWCIGTERLAGPTDPRPSHKARLIASR